MLRLSSIIARSPASIDDTNQRATIAYQRSRILAITRRDGYGDEKGCIDGLPNLSLREAGRPASRKLRQLEHLERPGVLDGLVSCCDTQPLVDPMQMRLHRVRLDHQLVRNLAIRQPPLHQPQDLSFAPAQCHRR